MGDPYVTTLLRDHEHGAWVVSCWGDMLEEYEREHKLAGHEEFSEKPEHCPSCHGSNLTLERQPHSARGPDSLSWVCGDCNHHCLAVAGYADGRHYHVVSVIDPVKFRQRWGVDPSANRVRMTASSTSHSEACTIMQKQVPHPWVRYMLEEDEE